MTPKVVGSAWMPWLRPMVGVILYSSARFLSAASRASVSPIRMSAARASCTFRQVSSTSDEVMPWCTKRASGPTILGQMGQEGDDVMLDLALDLVDPRHVEFGVLALFPDLLGRVLRHHAQFGQLASVACASISNQMRNLVSGDQIETICSRA